MTTYIDYIYSKLKYKWEYEKDVIMLTTWIGFVAIFMFSGLIACVMNNLLIGAILVIVGLLIAFIPFVSVIINDEYNNYKRWKNEQ